MLSKPPRAGTDLVIASHGNPFAAVAGTPYLAEGEAAVIRPLGAQGFAIVARVRKDEWEKLTPSASSTAPVAAVPCRRAR